MLLVAHPEARGAAAAAISATAEREGAALTLRYEATGDVAALSWPSAQSPMRADNLWRHTCFEAFVREEANDAYVELNFSPSTQWAAYRFSAYRAGMIPALGVPMPRIKFERGAHAFVLTARVDLGAVLRAGATWRCGLTAVIEETSGAKSYWALAHPSGAPDFHHGDGFIVELA